MLEAKLHLLICMQILRSNCVACGSKSLIYDCLQHVLGTGAVAHSNGGLLPVFVTISQRQH